MFALNAIPGMTSPEILAGRHNLFQMIEAVHSNTDPVHQLAPLFPHIIPKQQPHGRMDLKQPRVKQLYHRFVKTSEPRRLHAMELC